MSGVHVETGADSVSVTLQEDLTFSKVAELRPELERALNESAAGGRELTVSLHHIRSFDLSGVQLLFSLKSGAESRGVTILFDAGSNADRLSKMLSFTGLPAL